MKPLLTAVLAALLPAACSGDSAAIDPDTPAREGASACAGGETVVFACTTGANRDIALCASEDAGQLRYIDGGAGAATPPEAGAMAAATVRSGTLMYSGGGGAFLRFDRGGLVHTVYTGIGRGWEKAGVVVQEDGRTVRELACDGEVTSTIGPDLFERMAIPADDSGFEIP